MTLTQTELGIELLFDAARQREVEILSSEQQVLADGGAFEFNVAALTCARTRLKSDVPPPMSQISTSSPSRTCVRKRLMLATHA